MPISYELTGKKFGRYTVLGFARRHNTRRYWACKCDCGNEREVSTAGLCTGVQKSCGCLKLDMLRSSKSIEHGLAAKRDVYRNYRQHARRKGLPFELSYDDFINVAAQNCFYCGLPPANKQKPKGHNGDFIYQGIDRKDNTKGYTMDNVLPCCEMCNKAKRDKEYDEFLEWIKRIVATWTDTN